MRILLLAATIALLATAGCVPRNSVQGGATENGGGARINWGIPF